MDEVPASVRDEIRNWLSNEGQAQMDNFIPYLQSFNFAKADLYYEDYENYYVNIVEHEVGEYTCPLVKPLRRMVYAYAGSYGHTQQTQDREIIWVDFRFLAFIKETVSPQPFCPFREEIKLLNALDKFLNHRPWRLRVFLECCLPTRTFVMFGKMGLPLVLFHKLIIHALETFLAQNPFEFALSDFGKKRKITE